MRVPQETTVWDHMAKNQTGAKVSTTKILDHTGLKKQEMIEIHATEFAWSLTNIKYAYIPKEHYKT